MVTAVHEENYQPQVRDTTTGPHLHTYIPRDDGTVLIGDAQYMRTTPGIGATTVGVAVAGAAPVMAPVPAVAAPTVAVPGVLPAFAMPLNTAAVGLQMPFPTLPSMGYPYFDPAYYNNLFYQGASHSDQAHFEIRAPRSY
jgi:hypothetical protein